MTIRRIQAIHYHRANNFSWADKIILQRPEFETVEKKL